MQPKCDFPLSVRGRRRMCRTPQAERCALCMGGCGRRANLSKLYFSRPPACGIALQKQPILISSTSRTSDWVSPARSGFTTFCHQKVAPKVSAGRKSRGTADGLRLKRYADKLAPAFSTAHPPPVLLPVFSQCGVCCALRATEIICLCPYMADLRPARMLCENSG